MRKPLRATQPKPIQKSKKSGNRRSSQLAGTYGHAPRSPSRSQKKKIWHNWLMQEDFVG